MRGCCSSASSRSWASCSARSSGRSSSSPAGRRSRTSSACSRTSAARADQVLIGGKMAEQMRDENPLTFEVELPTDVVAAAEFAEDAESKVVPYDELPDGWLGLDIGPETREAFAAAIAEAKTVFWNGPMGVFEWPRFAEGTKAVAEAVAKADAHTVVGGADSVRALTETGARGRGRLGLDGRWRFPRAPGRERIAGRGSDPGGRSVLIAGNWKMYKGVGRDGRVLRRAQAARGGLRGHRRRSLPAVHLARRGRAGPGRDGHRRRRAERPLGGRGRVHRRGLGADAARARGLRRDRRPLGAAPATSARPTRTSRSAHARRSTPGCP